MALILKGLHCNLYLFLCYAYLLLQPMIAELERVGQQRSKGEADFSDLYDRLSHATQTCRQAVTKRLAIITSLVDYYNHWQLVSLGVITITSWGFP